MCTVARGDDCALDARPAEVRNSSESGPQAVERRMSAQGRACVKTSNAVEPLEKLFSGRLPQPSRAKMIEPSRALDVRSARGLEKSSSGVGRATVFTQPRPKVDVYDVRAGRLLSS